MSTHEIIARLDRIEARIARLEGTSTDAPAQTPATPPASPWSAPSAQQTQSPWSGAAQASAGSAPKAHHAPAIKESSGNWLGVVAILCFVLAAGFIVKLSLESGWLTPLRQLSIAALFGFGLIGAGFRMPKTDRAYASLLPGAGVIILYLTSFAAHRYYSVISFEGALLLMSLVSGLCIWLYTQLKHDAYAITAAIGAYLSPDLLGLHENGAFTLYYYLFCSAAFAIISIRVQSRTLTLISSYLALFMSAAIGKDLGNDTLMAGVMGAHFIIFALGCYGYSVQHNTALSKKEATSFLPVLLLFYAMEYSYVVHIYPGLAPWISLGFAAFLGGLYFAAKQTLPKSEGSQSLVLSFTTLVLFHSVYLELLPDQVRPWLLVVLLLAAAFLPKKCWNTGTGPWLPRIAIGIIIICEYLQILIHLTDTTEPFWLVLAMASLASLWALILAAFATDHPIHSRGQTLLAAAHTLAILGLYRLCAPIGSLAVSGGWLFYAMAVIALAYQRKDQTLAKPALLVLVLAAGKALLYDAASAPTIVRIGCLMVTGCVLYGCGYLMRQIGQWKTVDKQ